MRSSPAKGAGAAAGAAAPVGRGGVWTGRAFGAGRTADFFFGATRRTVVFFFAGFFLTGVVFLRVAGVLAGFFFRFTLVFVFFLAAICTLRRVSKLDKEDA